MQNYTIVAYYTINTKYELLANKLKENLNSLGLNYYLQGIKNLGSWALNDYYRPVFLQAMIKKYGRIVSLDVDCVVHKPLDYCNRLQCIIAMRKFHGSVPILGTMFLWGKQAIEIMKLWEVACTDTKGKRHCSQTALRKVIKEYNLYIGTLPDEYAILEREEAIPDNAVVVHDYARDTKCQI